MCISVNVYACVYHCCVRACVPVCLFVCSCVRGSAFEITRFPTLNALHLVHSTF